MPTEGPQLLDDGLRFRSPAPVPDADGGAGSRKQERRGTAHTPGPSGDQRVLPTEIDESFHDGSSGSLDPAGIHLPARCSRW